MLRLKAQKVTDVQLIQTVMDKTLPVMAENGLTDIALMADTIAAIVACVTSSVIAISSLTPEVLTSIVNIILRGGAGGVAMAVAVAVDLICTAVLGVAPGLMPTIVAEMPIDRPARDAG